MAELQEEQTQIRSQIDDELAGIELLKADLDEAIKQREKAVFCLCGGTWN
jgi:hypothetical protein